MGQFKFSRSDAEHHFKVTITDSDWQAVEEALEAWGDFGINFTSCSGPLCYDFDNSEVLEEIEYARHEQISLESELIPYTYTHWSDIENFWETEIEIAVIDAVKAELENIGVIPRVRQEPIENNPDSRNPEDPSTDSSPF